MASLALINAAITILFIKDTKTFSKNKIKITNIFSELRLDIIKY